MSIEDTDKVDFVGVSDKKVNLVITDHLEWGDNDEDHLYLLQEKINTYLRFYEGGELVDNFPGAVGKPVGIEIVLKYEPSYNANWFFEKVEPILENAGVSLVVNVARKRDS